MGVWALAIGAMTLRWLYVLATPYNIRTYDTEAHLEYTRWILRHWSIPKAAEGYEFYHPPLYHGLAALWSILMGGWNGETLDTRKLQILSLLIACMTVAVIVFIATQLFRSWEDKKQRLPFVALIAFLPGFLMFSSRVNNDTLTALIQYAAVFFLVRWWGIPERRRDWYLSLVLLGLGMLTKMNTIVLLPLPFLCLLVLRPMPKRAYRMMFLGGVIALFFLCLVPSLRWMVNGESPFGKMIPNIGVLGSLLLPPTKFWHLIGFHPLHIVHIPFNDNWNDAALRMYVWDYLMRSALSGEWFHGPLHVFLAQIQLALGLVMLLPALWGLKTRWKFLLTADAPITLMIPLFLIGELAYRISYPFSCSQDFRYVTFIAIPMAYFLMRGIEGLPPVLRFKAMALLWFFVGSMILFVWGLMVITV